MPLLHRKPFLPLEYPYELKESDEVFVCYLTGEIFKDYDDFCERIILCNSLVWSCSLTGRSNLTYQEAAASEDKVKKLLKRFPIELREPVLYLSSICERRSLVELAEEVFFYVKDRFFIGEKVEVEFPEGQVSCHVTAVIPPTTQELKTVKSKDRDERHHPPAVSYKYEVERTDTDEVATVKASQVSRKKASYNKDKNRLYIKQFVHNDQGIWKLKESTNTKYGISKIKFSQIFCGDPPDMGPKKPVKHKPSPDKGRKQETINKYFKAGPKKVGLSPRKSPKKGDLSHPQLKRKRRSRKEMEEDKIKLQALKKEMKLKKKARVMESRARYNEFVREWNMEREDLECEDLKELPTPHPVQINFPTEYFGDVAMFMEFFSSFKKILDIKDFFPHGITFELLERSFVEKEVAGPYSDLIQLLLARIFGLLGGEEQEAKNTEIKGSLNIILEKVDPQMTKLSRLAAMTEFWVRKHHGIQLPELQLDTSTITEVLRLHLLVSGSISDKSNLAKWRYQARGGYLNCDDPGLHFRADHPEIIDKLGSQSVFELDTGEKIEIVKCLIDQILTYSATRDIIEEGCDKAKQCRIELRALRAEQTRKEKEEAIRLKDIKKAGLLRADEVASEVGKKTEEERALRSTTIGDRKQTIEYMIYDLNDALRSAQMSPLGMDRAYRRYWLFMSIPGLFVEENYQDRGPCLPKPTPSAVYSSEDSHEYIKMLFNESSNKENISDLPSNVLASSPKKLLAEKNGEATVVARTHSKSDSQSSQPLTCWADPESCPVHGSNAMRPQWSFIADKSEFERLVASLNRRGTRERKLKEALNDEKERIFQTFDNFPSYLFSPDDEDAEPNPIHQVKAAKVMKIYKNANLGFPLDVSMDEINESLLRDLILETESKISGGALGYLRVKDREVWRKAISNRSYDKQCKQITWGCSIREEGAVVNGDEEMDVDVDSDSDCSSAPSLEYQHKRIRSFKKGFVPVPQKQVIFDLASAITQIEQSIEHKFLKRPLGLSEKEKERTSKKIPTPAMERWEMAVMESTSFSQLFLHLSTLENSVIWAKSALNAYCRLCRRKEDPENMLLCDKCNKGHHMYCLKPKLVNVPSGDWYCPRCKPREMNIPAKRARRMFSDEPELTEEMECNSCNDPGAQLVCDRCDIKLHLSCVNPPVRKAPKSKWFCHDCRSQNAVLSKKETGLVESEVDSPQLKNESKPKKEAKLSVERSRTPQHHLKRSEGLFNGSKMEPDAEWDHPNGLVEEVERLSRRKCSKAATAKISQFAKQLRSSQWAENGEMEEFETRQDMRTRPARSRRSLESVKKSRDLPLDNAALQEILERLMHHKEAWPFLRPVTKSEVPDYHLIIKKPMDFATIKHKLNMLEYTRNSELIADAQLLFDNCYLYNQEGSEVYKAGETLHKLFFDLCAEHNIK